MRNLSSQSKMTGIVEYSKLCNLNFTQCKYLKDQLKHLPEEFKGDLSLLLDLKWLRAIEFAVQAEELEHLENAELFWKQALHEVKENCRKKDPRLLLTLEGLARFYIKKGAFLEAEVCAFATTSIVHDVLGAEHPRCADSLGMLGTIYYRLNQTETATTCFRRALMVNLRYHGRIHQRSLKSAIDLANHYLSCGHLKKALRIFSYCMRLSSRLTGADSPETVFLGRRKGFVIKKLYSPS